MFTGLSQGMGTLARLPGGGRDRELSVRPGFPWDSPLRKGESVMVSGVCLTVREPLPDGSFLAYASAETLRLSTLGAATKVNLERALRLSDRLGGHIVSGHVDCLATLFRKEPAGKSMLLAFRYPRELSRHVVPKGSVTIDGISLTVNEAPEGMLTVNVIPETLSVTTLSTLTVGSKANMETDVLAKYVEGLLSGKGKTGLTLERLLKEGL
ncbi:MAG: riboflavin synthase [Deltaproteobacteria bacterium]|jgi:riboflavin synthase|nr:riboflavin synthase [Deltaproteobacteria bacterium]